MGLFLLVYIFLGVTLAGSFMVAALTMGLDTWQPIVAASLAGFAVAIPLAWVIARRIKDTA